MNKVGLLFVTLLLVLTAAWFLQPNTPGAHSVPDKENELKAGAKREYHEWYISRDPVTNTIPKNIRKMEIDWSKAYDQKRSGLLGAQVSNQYTAAGPSRYGGRTRALAFDLRNNGTTNRVVLSGGVQGGIFRSEDGGVNWSFVHPPNEIRSVTCIAQDPRPGFQDTWYAGTGESQTMSFWPNALVFGYGILKSVDNGKTWTKLASTSGSTNEFGFDSFFDFVQNIAVHPVTGDIYVAAFAAIIRMTNGGNSWQLVLGNNPPKATSRSGYTDILINKTGSAIYASFSGNIKDRPLVGLWTSPNGNLDSWIRMAGGVENAADSVAGWRAYDSTGTDDTKGWGRISMALSANQQQLYALVENNLDYIKNSDLDLFRANIAATPVTWSSNLGNNIRANFNGTSERWPSTQQGYCMTIACHPTINNTVYVGGVSLMRSPDGFASKTNNTYIGGFGGSALGGNFFASNTTTDPDLVSHVDFHTLAFDPSSPNRMIAASDGGLAITDDATAAKITWYNGNNNYQTIQYYYVGLDPLIGSRTFYGGSQDNQITVRDLSNVFGPARADSNDHLFKYAGDGCQAYLLRSPQPYFIFGLQEQNIFRALASSSSQPEKIKPSAAGDEKFVTYFHLDEDNPNNLYFPSQDTLYRTNSPQTVTANSWTRIQGVDQLLTGEIYSLATTKGQYTPNNVMYIGTGNGKIYRLRDPANSTTAQPVDITPGGMPNNVIVYDIAVNPRNHDTILATVSNYNAVSVYWTGNATSSSPIWQAIEGNVNLPSVRSCEIIATTTGVEYYIGTTVGLFSTKTISDISTNWTREIGGPNGMMNTGIINSLASRWQDNTLLVGTHSNGMFVANIGNAITIPTGINDPIRDNKNFIVKAFPTITSNIISYQAGTMLNIRSIQVQVYTLGGQLLHNQNAAYTSGQVNLGALPSGPYILTITSNDRKYQFVRRFTKS